MDDPQLDSRLSASDRGHRAEAVLAQLFAKAGWDVRRQPHGSEAAHPDMIVQKGKVSYLVEVKAAPEGRSDRLIPLWSQAYLEAVRLAGDRRPPLVVVAAPRIGPQVATNVLEFATQYAPDAAVGVIDFEGLRLFRGPQLDDLSSGDEHGTSRARSEHPEPANLFSDLNQWMLKVLLAPELPEQWLWAPRGHYRNASQLARAANASVMSALRLVQSLGREGYLHEAAPYLGLVRREELLRRWQAASSGRVVKERPMRFVLRGDPQKELRRMLRSGRACLALFAAAKELGFGFVSGVPQHVYVQRMSPASLAAWKSILPVEPGERADLIVRQAAFPQSVFRALVRPHGIPSADILQTWLDVSSHPARGQEQGDLIWQKVFAPHLLGKHARG